MTQLSRLGGRSSKRRSMDLGEADSCGDSERESDAALYLVREDKATDGGGRAHTPTATGTVGSRASPPRCFAAKGWTLVLVVWKR